MKKILIIPVLLICLTGASSRRAEPIRNPVNKVIVPAINTKVDSVDMRLRELNNLLHKS